ncbi:unnamed protein product [Leptosia nina]|uniref:Uncharacterized protein n=1 Tax=Leptosia nina TaxID=320188 RepID=A0AAV1JSD9_9NEOP
MSVSVRSVLVEAPTPAKQKGPYTFASQPRALYHNAKLRRNPSCLHVISRYEAMWWGGVRVGGKWCTSVSDWIADKLYFAHEITRKGINALTPSFSCCLVN